MGPSHFLAAGVTPTLPPHVPTHADSQTPAAGLDPQAPGGQAPLPSLTPAPRGKETPGAPAETVPSGTPADAAGTPAATPSPARSSAPASPARTSSAAATNLSSDLSLTTASPPTQSLATNTDRNITATTIASPAPAPKPTCDDAYRDVSVAYQLETGKKTFSAEVKCQPTPCPEKKLSNLSACDTITVNLTGDSCEPAKKLELHVPP
ncbi:receptor-type tyrosine-protein phosphatase C-like, partial [Pteropus vampyrus]|uniref:Receptor-type tyrosine-protein phosphatase C-like n=1 Tax=Pteropus vampyrus TaxID=132908 RepID=A0A6P3RSC1_PTEVA